MQQWLLSVQLLSRLLTHLLVLHQRPIKATVEAELKYIIIRLNLNNPFDVDYI